MLEVVKSIGTIGQCGHLSNPLSSSLDMILLIFLVLHFISSSLEFGFQGKRGIEKQPFQLPDFIAATGIEKIRQV